MSSLNDKEKERIREEAKKVMDSFAKSLDKVKLKEVKIEGGEEGYRNEGNGVKGSEDFRNRMFDNAPNKEGDFIIAESKQW